MNPPQQRSLVDRYLAAYNAFDVAAMLEVLHPEIEFRNVTAGEITASVSGLEAFRRLAEESTRLFTTRRQELTAFRANGATATAEIRFEAVLAQDLPDDLRAGQLLRLEGRTEFGFRDGLIDRIVDRS